MNKDNFHKNEAFEYLTGLRKRIERFSQNPHFHWEVLKQPQAKTIPVIPVTGGASSKGVLKHYQNKDYWKP